MPATLDKNGKKDEYIVTKVATMSYANLFEPRSFKEGDTPKYSCNLIFSKDDKAALAQLKAAYAQALADGANVLKGLPPSQVLLKDGDAEHPDKPEYANSIYLVAKSKFQPTLMDRARNPIDEDVRDTLYSGCRVRAMLTFRAYNNGGMRGVTAYLQGVQKIADGPRLGGLNAAAAFDDGFEPSLTDELAELLS
jgi:hypothetical protein